MTAAIPTIEPTTLVAGDTWTWKRANADYPASAGWTLRYVFTGTEQRFTFDSTADGADHLVSRATTDTDDVVPGTYQWAAFARNGTERYQVATGTLIVKPNLEGARPFDLRSDARKIYEALVALQVDYAAGKGLVAEYTIAGRTMRFRDSGDLLKQLTFWKAQVDAEEAAERINRGEPAGNRLLVRL